MRCVYRPRGRAWVGVEEEMARLGECGEEGRGGRSREGCKLRALRALRTSVPSPPILTHAHTHAHAGIYPYAWPLPLTREGVQNAQASPRPFPLNAPRLEQAVAVTQGLQHGEAPGADQAAAQQQGGAQQGLASSPPAAAPGPSALALEEKALDAAFLMLRAAEGHRSASAPAASTLAKWRLVGETAFRVCSQMGVALGPVGPVLVVEGGTLRAAMAVPTPPPAFAGLALPGGSSAASASAQPTTPRGRVPAAQGARTALGAVRQAMRELRAELDAGPDSGSAPPGSLMSPPAAAEPFAQEPFAQASPPAAGTPSRRSPRGKRAYSPSRDDQDGSGAPATRARLEEGGGCDREGSPGSALDVLADVAGAGLQPSADA